MLRTVLASVLAAALVACSAPAVRPDPRDTLNASAPAAPPAGASRILTLSPEAFTAECERALTEARGRVAQLKALDAKVQGRKVLDAYDSATAELSNAAARASLAKNVHPDEGMRDAAEKCEQALEAFSVELSLDRGVYDALAAVNLQGEDPATQKWMEKALLEFRRAGVDRDDATRAQVKALNEELVLLGQEFGKNIRDDVREVRLSPKELEGLPADYVRAHPAGKDGKVVITSNYPDYMPFMAYAKSAKAREALWRAYRMRGHPKNLDVLSKLLAKRHALATLLGYKSWAAYATENKMTRSDEVAADFIQKVTQAAESRAKEEYDALLALKRRTEPKATRVEPWEQEQLEDRLKAERFGFDSQALRPYFEYAAVKQGVMDTTARIFGITYRPVKDAPVWHADVETYDVLEGDRVLGRIHLDMHPRDGKYKHAAQFDLTTGQRGVRAPEGVLVCNFPKSEEGAPGLMQPTEVETFFHEFGHLLHHVFGGHQRWATISGIRTEWDFVEVPSMLLQEWATDPDVLKTFARHHETGTPVPADLVEKLRASKDFGKGLFTRRQMFLAAVSLDFHRQPPGFDTTERMKQLQESYLPFRREHVDGTYFHLAFGHLEGYSAAYYTYIWSVVIAKDLLTAFEKEGMLAPAPAQRLRQAVLGPGGSKEAAALVKDFLGREYSFDAYQRWMNAG